MGHKESKVPGMGVNNAICHPGSLLIFTIYQCLELIYLSWKLVRACFCMYTELRRLGSQSEGVGEMSGLHGAFANGTQSVLTFLQSGYVTPNFFKEGVAYSVTWE